MWPHSGVESRRTLVQADGDARQHGMIRDFLILRLRLEALEMMLKAAAINGVDSQRCLTTIAMSSAYARMESCGTSLDDR